MTRIDIRWFWQKLSNSWLKFRTELLIVFPNALGLGPNMSPKIDLNNFFIELLINPFPDRRVSDFLLNALTFIENNTRHTNLLFRNQAIYAFSVLTVSLTVPTS